MIRTIFSMWRLYMVRCVFLVFLQFKVEFFLRRPSWSFRNPRLGSHQSARCRFDLKSNLFKLLYNFFRLIDKRRYDVNSSYLIIQVIYFMFYFVKLLCNKNLACFKWNLRSSISCQYMFPLNETVTRSLRGRLRALSGVGKSKFGLSPEVPPSTRSTNRKRLKKFKRCSN